MTREDAIKILKGGNNRECTWSEYCEAYNMAIKALEQETVSKETYDHEYLLRKKMEIEIDHLRRYISKLETQITLEQEPTTKNDLGVDLVSRADVLKLMQDNWHTHNGDWAMQESMDDIRALSSVTPQEPRWIPVSEKLPNDRDWYLGIFKEPDTGWINPIPFICDYVGSETKATTKEHWILRGFTDKDEHIDYYFNLECIAWMPLPSSSSIDALIMREVKE